MFIWRHILLICILVYLSRPGVSDAYPTEDERISVPVVFSQLTSRNEETSPCPYPNLVIYPNTSIIYKPNSNLKISCIGDHLPSNFVIRLYQIKNDKYYIRASTTSNELRTELYLTEQDDGTSLQCYIIWKYHSKTTKTIDLMLDRAPKENSVQDERNFDASVSSQFNSAKEGASDVYPTEDERIDEEEDERMFVSSQLTSTNEEASPCPYPNLVIYPNTSIIYKPNSNLKISCIGDHLPSNFVIRLYQIKNDKYYIRASTTSNVLRTELYLIEQDDASSLQCYIMWKYHSKTTKTIDLLLERAPKANSVQDERNFEAFVSSQFNSANEGASYVNPVEDERNSLPFVSSQLTSKNEESFWGDFDLVTATIVIVILLIIIFLMVTRAYTRDFLCFDSMPSYPVNLMNFVKNYDGKLNTCDDYKKITDK